jgi:HEAT repeat protein
MATMTYQSIIDVLATYRRPGTPNFERHFQRLPQELLQQNNVGLLLGILTDNDLPAKIRGHAAGALGEIGDRRVAGALVEALGNARLRRCVVVALGRLGAPVAAEALTCLAQQGDAAARWALARVTPGTDSAEVIAELEHGQLRGIRSRLQALDERVAVAVGEDVLRRLHLALDRETPCQGWAWMITSLQYLLPPGAGPLLTEALGRLNPESAELRNRLLRALGAVAPLDAVPALLTALQAIESPGHQQLTAVCLEKILARHGEPARCAMRAQAPVLRRVLDDLHARDRHTAEQQADVPWDHRPGTAGWRAEVRRAEVALTRLLAHLEKDCQS